MRRSPPRPLLALLCAVLLLATAFQVRADDLWVKSDASGEPRIQLYFFWSLTCPHCTEAHPHVLTLAQQRPWLELHELELSRSIDNVRQFEKLARAAGGDPAAVPSFIFCGELHSGWDVNGRMADLLAQRLAACRVRIASGQPAAHVGSGSGARIDIPFVGSVDPAGLSLPALTLVLAGLDAFNPCAFFVLLFLLSMMAHQKSRRRMLLIGGVFVTISGLMYFSFMAAWLNVFQLFGHLAWVTVAAGALAVFVGLVNVKDFFWFERGLSLSIPESKKPAIFRRARTILNAEDMPAMLAATVFLAIAANFYELLCTAGFPMVYTRLLTLANLSASGHYVWLAIYNLIYVLPLTAIVVAFARTLGARKLTEREGRLLKLMSGLMMLGLGGLLLLAPERISQVGVAFALMGLAIGITWLAARLTGRDNL